MSGRPSAMLFDLDGTLADTAPDLVGALNRLRTELGLAPVPFWQVAPHVSKGGRAMLAAGLGERADDDGRLLDRFLALYRAEICVATRLYDGIDAVLDALEAARVPWGIVTNKPGWLTAPLLDALGLAARCRVTVSGDTLPVRKPDPAPLRHALAALGVDAAGALMVGDDARDLEAARAAGARAVYAAWGYLAPGDDPSRWPADVRAGAPRELLALIGAGR